MKKSFRFSYVTVIGVEDGDSIEVLIDQGFRQRQDHKVRLAGIDAPEVPAKGTKGEEARDWLRQMLPPGTAVELVTEKPKDKYGRYLAWVWCAGAKKSVNEAMIDAGHARPYSGGKR